MPARPETLVSIPADGVQLEGNLTIPANATGLVIFAHGSGSSRHSPRNNYVANVLNERGLATLLFDLLTEAEDRSRANRFDVERLTSRLLDATDWAARESRTQDLRVGYFGSSTGAAAALRAAATRGRAIEAVVSRGGRVDMAEPVLEQVRSPTLFVVGEADADVRKLNREAYEQLHCEKAYEVIAGAGHLFEGPGQLETVAEVATDWFDEHLA
jgi:dienelactone hydrolase